ncbi:hypothetical protein RvVAR031_36250 [Agrobacterium vitis]|nr:hypothetical protein RvVAR031_36250 [Agrobacterium vitis]
MHQGYSELITMGKHSDFARRAHDEYLTPYRGAYPLIPYLANVATFAEPCAANGQLIRHIEKHGPLCIHSGDIRTGTDALECPTLRSLVVDCIITNPPYTWSVLRRMLELFPTIAPTWLLLEATFPYTDQSAPYMRLCTDIVPAGSIKWFAGTKHASKERYAWFRFAQDAACAPSFHIKKPIPRGI